MTVEASPGSAILTVDDAGPGVDPGDRERIFERFARGRGARGGQPGTGLGLSIVAETVRAHGGSVWCTTAPTGGARFVLRLPLASPPEPVPAPPPTTTTGGEAQAGGAPGGSTFQAAP